MDLGQKDEEVLMRRLNAHDQQAFEVVFHKYYAALCFFAYKFLRDEEAARDVVQEVFIRFFEKTYVFPNFVALKSFLYSCVQHRALNHLEKNNNRMALRERMRTDEVEENEYFHHQIEAEIFEEIFAAIEKLPPECRRIFKMSYIDHLDIREITEQLNIAESTVKTQRQRAKKILREQLRHLYPLIVILFF